MSVGIEKRKKSFAGLGIVWFESEIRTGKRVGFL